MIVRTALNVLAAGCVLTGKALVAARLRAEPAGWRRMLGVGMRAEASKFALPAFGLKVPDATADGDFNARIVQALFAFLQTEPEARYWLTHDTWVTTRHAIKHVDLVVQHFNADGTLARIEPHFAPANPDPTDPATLAKVCAALVAAYNRTRHLPEARRPAQQIFNLRGALSGVEPLSALRLLTAVCVSFESRPEGAARFALPDARTRRGLGHGFLTFVVRPDAASATADAWSVVHHVGADGAPWQEAMTRLERAWGNAPVTFPDAGTVLGPHACFAPGEREVYETLSFHDFSHLLTLRKRLNVRLAAQIGGDITFGALLLWRLAREPEFAGTRFGTTLEVPATGAHERDVDLIALKPDDFGADSDAALVAFAREFNRLVAAARGRSSPLRQSFKDAELLPAWLHRKLLEYSPERVRRELGDVGVSVVRDAKVVVGTIPDVGFPSGFIAIGNLALPTASGRAVGAVSVKATDEQARAYPAAVRRALERCNNA